MTILQRASATLGLQWSLVPLRFLRAAPRIYESLPSDFRTHDECYPTGLGRSCAPFERAKGPD